MKSRVVFRISILPKVCPDCGWLLEVMGGRIEMTHDGNSHEQDFKCCECGKTYYEVTENE